MRHFTIPVFVPELACPNRCIFCNQRQISGTLCQPGLGEANEIIEKHLSTIPAGNDVEIGFFGGNFRFRGEGEGFTTGFGTTGDYRKNHPLRSKVPATTGTTT